MNDSSKCPEDRLDAATSRRLAKLAGRPVDAASLERKLTATLATAPTPMARPAWWWCWRRPLQAAAAVALLVLVGWAVTQGGSPAVAAPAELVQLHRQMLAGELETMPVTSVEAANVAIAERWARAPHLPHAPGAQVMACCLHELRGARLVMVRLEYEDAAVKLVVARSRDIRSPEGRNVERDGRHFVLHEHAGLTMAMTNEDDRWLCVMGELSEQKLLELAGRIEF